MIVRTALLFLGLASFASSTCICSWNYTKSYPTFVIQSAYDNANFDNCEPATPNQCTVVINQNDGSKGVGGFVVTEFDVGSGDSFTVVIKDGDQTVFTLTRSNYANYKEQLALYASFDPVVTILLQYYGDKDVIFNMYAYPKSITTLPTAPTTPTPPPTGGTAGLLGADIAFAFDSTGTDQAVFTTMKKVMKDTVNQLTVVEDVNQPYGARLSLQSISSSNAANNLAVPWAVTKEEFLQLVDVIPTRNKKSFYLYPFEAFLENRGYFSPVTVDGANSRTNVQRIYAIFTQHEPDDDLPDLNMTLTYLKGRDVHLVVHWFGPKPSNVFKYLSSTYPNFAYLDYDPANPMQLYNNYILNGDSDAKFGCSNGKTSAVDTFDQAGMWPPNYFPGYINYCNNQDVVLQFTDVAIGTTALCISVENYQLELEKDYVRFYDGAGVEVAFLTGNNVFGAEFQINGTAGSARLTTNEYLVYSGIRFGVRAISDEPPQCNLP